MAPSTKRGIAVPWNFSPAHFSLYQPALSAGTLSWVSNWELWKPSGLPASAPFVPQLRTAAAAAELPQYFAAHAPDPCVHDVLLGLNEPDIAAQANIAAAEAAALWRAHVLPLKALFPQLRLGSPAVSNAPAGLQWLEDFFAALGGVAASGVDFVALHYYSPDEQHFEEYVAGAFKRFGKPLWVTEFACTEFNPTSPATEAQVLAFMSAALKFLEGAHYVERYAWFGAMEDVGDAVGRANGLQDGEQLSAAGKLYTSF
jgi:hypothetical protein